MLNKGYTFQAIQPLPENLIPMDSGLLLTHVDRIPPHIGYCQNGIYYSLTNSVQPKPQSLSRVFMLINQKKIPSLFVQIQEPASRPSHDGIENLFKHAPPMDVGGSCLMPVRSILEIYWGVQVKNPLIHGLMQQLETQNLIVKTWHKNLKSDVLTDKNVFSIQHYNEKEVRHHIRSLLQKLV